MNKTLKKYQTLEERSLVMEPDQLSILFPEYLRKIDQDIKVKLNGVATLSYKGSVIKVHNKRNYSFLDSKIHALSFFSGAGGLDIGAQMADVKVISSLDFDRDSILTLKQNKFFMHAEHMFRDISTVTSKDYSKILKLNNPEKLIMVGGPPCQPFSKAGYWVTNKNRLASEDPRNMIGNYLKLINEVRPDGFLLENVESLLHPTNKIAVAKIEEAVQEMGYNYIIVKANALNYGVPQKRKRIFIVASRTRIEGLPNKTHGSDQEILANPSLKPFEKVINWIGKYDSEEFFEKQELTSKGTYFEDLVQVPPGKNYIALTAAAGYPNPKFIAQKRFWSFLLKLHPLEPSWTIAAQPGPWVGPFHWTSRRLRVPEIAAIQTFPEDYSFAGSRRSIQKQIGNAVPPLLGKAMVEFLAKNI